MAAPRLVDPEKHVGKQFSLTVSERGYANMLLTEKNQLDQRLGVIAQEIEKVCEEINARLGLPAGTTLELKGDKVVMRALPREEGKASEKAKASPDAPPADPKAAEVPEAP